MDTITLKSKKNNIKIKDKTYYLHRSLEGEDSIYFIGTSDNELFYDFILESVSEDNMFVRNNFTSYKRYCRSGGLLPIMSFSTREALIEYIQQLKVVYELSI